MKILRHDGMMLGMLMIFILICQLPAGCNSHGGIKMRVKETAGCNFFITADGKNVLLYGVHAIHVNEDIAPGFNDESSEYFRERIVGKIVRVVSRGEEVINGARCIMGLVYLDNGVLLNEELLNKGYVCVEPREMENDPLLLQFRIDEKS